MTELWAILLVVFATLIGSWGSLLLKKGAEAFSLNLRKLFSNYHVLLGLFLYVVSSVFFIWALTGGELTVLYPVTSLTYIWVALMSVKFLNERMNKFKWLGIVLIMVGISLIGAGS